MGIKFNDSDLTIEWPEPYSLEGYIVSDKDKNLINGDADVFFVPKSYAANPNDLLYCAGLIPPNDSLILSSLYQWM